MARIRLPVVALLLGLAAAEAARAGDDIPTACEPVEEPAPSAPPAPHAGLTALERARFDAGERAFRRVETPASGLGPVFNAESCVACHGQPSAGGSSRTAVTRFARADGAFDPLPARGGPVLQKHGLCGDACVVPGETVPAEATIVTLRDTQPLFGLGFLDAVPEAQIAARADPDDRDGDGISGRPQLIAGRVGRFGWKAQVPTLEEFASLASLNEIGITSPALPAEVAPQGEAVVCDDVPDPEDDGSHMRALTDFMVLLAAPQRRPPSPKSRRGRALFRRLGCGHCHVRTLRTGAHPVAALHERRVHAFTNLLLHDMGPELADGMEQGEATGREFRTPPLMGIADSAPYLHDGRAETLADAVAAHGGEAASARDRFTHLTTQQQEALLAYLRSL